MAAGNVEKSFAQGISQNHSQVFTGHSLKSIAFTNAWRWAGGIAAQDTKTLQNLRTKLWKGQRVRTCGVASANHTPRVSCRKLDDHLQRYGRMTGDPNIAWW